MWRVLGAFVLLTGCRHAPLSYTLTAKGRETILVPPGGVRNEIAVRNARNGKQPDCDIPGDSIHLHWTGRTARIGVSPMEDSDGDRMYTDAVKSLEAFRAALREREAKGCLVAGSLLLQTITERLPLPPWTAYYLRFGAFGQAGFFDLTPDFRLKEVSPLPGGVEIGYYKITSTPKDDRVRLTLDSASATGVGKGSLVLPDSLGYFRILFWTSLSSADHFATLLASSDRASLEEATRRFQNEPSCQKMTVTCITIPPDCAVNAELRVQVNGSEQFVQLGGTVRDAVGNHSVFQVRRLFEGRAIPVNFDPTHPGIQQFVLMPGDQISW